MNKMLDLSTANELILSFSNPFSSLYFVYSMTWELEMKVSDKNRSSNDNFIIKLKIVFSGFEILSRPN